MGFWFTALLWVASTFLSGLLRPRRKANAPQPSSIGDFQAPTAEEGGVVPVIFGTCRLSAPNVLWYGDLLTGAISRSDQVVGYRYFLGIQYALCLGPVDSVLDVRWDGKAPGFTTTDHGSYWTLDFDAAGIFGGDDREGGVQGAMDVYKGTTTQIGSAYLAAKTGAAQAGLPGLCHAVLRQMYLGNSAYLKGIAFTVRRLPNTLGLTGGAHDIAGDANPAAVLYEILTDQRWGLGLSSGLIDAASFLAAGATLATETLGVSMVFDQSASASDLIEEVLRHVDGVIYLDTATGQLTLKLARADYTPAALLELNPSNVRSVKLSRGSWDETHNHVRVRYVDRASDFVERIAQAQDRANIEVRGGQVDPVDEDFRGLSNAAAAQRAAARLLKAESYPLAAVSIEANREAYGLRPADVFRLTWPPLGIVDMVCRVTPPLRDGEIGEGWLSIEAVEDVFAVTWTGYPDPIPSDWTPPVTDPQPLAAQRLLELPYALNRTGQNAEINVGTLGVQGIGFAQGYQVWADIGGLNYFHVATCREFTPSGRISATLGLTATSFVLQDPVGATLLSSCTSAELAGGENILLLDDELIAWQTIADNGDGTFTISGCVRGVADTTPKSHAALGRAWFLTAGMGHASLASFVSDGTVARKLLPFNSNGLITLGATSPVSVTTQSRASRPYVPTNIRLNAAANPTNIGDALAVTWAHRNRLDGSWTYSNAGQTAARETGTHYRVRVYGESGSLIHTEDNLTGTSWTYSLATEISDGGLGRPNGTLRVVVDSLTDVGALVSQQSYDQTVDAAGWGMLFGNYWNGTTG